MTDVYNKAALTRTWFAGADADTDIHIEAYEGDIDGSFRVDSLFRNSGLTNFKSVQNQTNAWRGDRIAGVSVKGRRSGEALDSQRIPNDKFIVVVDTVSYVRTPFDYQDDWTSPDFQSEYSAEHGTAHAKIFDTAHIVQLIKCAAFTPPAHLASSFHPGMSEALPAEWDTETNKEVLADMLVQAHKDLIATFVKRDLGGSVAELITLIKPDEFNVLLDHKKLMNVEFQGGAGDNSFAHRRVAVLNGIRVIETPRFPDAGTTATAGHVASVLGSAYEVSADEAKACMILFHPRKALVTVEAKSMTVRMWDDPKEFQSVLDSFHMYQVGQKRPDAVGVVFKP